MSDDREASREQASPGSAGRDGQEQKPGRSAAEWVTLAISAAIVLALVGTVTWLYIDDGLAEPVIEVTPHLGQVRQVAGQYYLPVEIRNTGGKTVETVDVTLSLTDSQGEEHEAQFTVDFLAGGASANGAAVFPIDPSDGELTVSSISYLQP